MIRKKLFPALILCSILASPSLGSEAPTSAPPDTSAQTAKSLRKPDVMYMPTPYPAVEAMLKLAKVRKGDVLYDLGSGDGRIVIAAAKHYGIQRGIGIDIDPQRITEANANAKKAGVTGRVRFRNEDLFTADFSDATVVTLYLRQDLNIRLVPKLRDMLAPGTRIVSYVWDMGDAWKPEQTVVVDGRSIYLWTVPAKPAP